MHPTSSTIAISIARSVKGPKVVQCCFYCSTAEESSLSRPKHTHASTSLEEECELKWKHRVHDGGGEREGSHCNFVFKMYNFKVVYECTI